MGVSGEKMDQVVFECWRAATVEPVPAVEARRWRRRWGGGGRWLWWWRCLRWWVLQLWPVGPECRERLRACQRDFTEEEWKNEPVFFCFLFFVFLYKGRELGSREETLENLFHWMRISGILLPVNTWAGKTNRGQGWREKRFLTGF